MIEIKAEFHYRNPVKTSQWKNSSKARNLIRRNMYKNARVRSQFDLFGTELCTTFRMYSSLNGKRRQFGICVTTTTTAMMMMTHRQGESRLHFIAHIHTIRYIHSILAVSLNRLGNLYTTTR